MTTTRPPFTATLCVLSALGFVVLSGCSEKTSEDPLADFSIGLFEAAKTNDVDTLVANYCANKEEALAHLKKIMKGNPDLSFAGGPDSISDAEIEQSHKDAIAIFINSYKDELAGKPVNWSAAVAEEFASTKLIVWAKMPDGSYRGIMIESVIETANGYKINDWLGPNADPTKHPSSLRRKKAILTSDTREGCTFPRGAIKYEYEFVN